MAMLSEQSKQRGISVSKHKQVYRIYPDDQTAHTNEDWKRADRYINGMASSGDMHEAVAIDKPHGNAYIAAVC
jgi:hypothetical protein